MTDKTATEATELRRRTVQSHLNRVPAWAMVVVIATAIATANLGLPFLVTWIWPGVDPTVLILGNLFLGLILGSAGVLGFLQWRWQVRR